MRNPTVHRDICGTENGYRKHGKRKEEPCQPCRAAWSIRCQKYNPARTTLDITEFITELEHLTGLGQGTDYILKAVGYAGREKQLRDRLQKHGRVDLFHRVCSEEYWLAA